MISALFSQSVVCLTSQCQFEQKIMIISKVLNTKFVCGNAYLDEEQKSIRAIQGYFTSLPFDQGIHTHQSGWQPKFSGLCTRTNQSHLAVISININTISQLLELCPNDVLKSVEHHQICQLGFFKTTNFLNCHIYLHG